MYGNIVRFNNGRETFVGQRAKLYASIFVVCLFIDSTPRTRAIPARMTQPHISFIFPAPPHSRIRNRPKRRSRHTQHKAQAHLFHQCLFIIYTHILCVVVVAPSMLVGVACLSVTPHLLVPCVCVFVMACSPFCVEVAIIARQRLRLLSFACFLVILFL